MTKQHAQKRRKTRMRSIKTDAALERVHVACLSEKQMDDPMHTTPSNNYCTNCNNDTGVMVMTAQTKFGDLIAKEVNISSAIPKSNRENHLLTGCSKQQCRIERNHNGLCQVPENDDDQSTQPRRCEWCYFRLTWAILPIGYGYGRSHKADSIQSILHTDSDRVPQNTRCRNPRRMLLNAALRWNGGRGYERSAVTPEQIVIGRSKNVWKYAQARKI